MKTLFDTNTYNETINRLNNLTPQSQRQWGKMDAAQMLTHCKEAFKIPLSEKPVPRMFLGILLGWMMKANYYNEKPWGKNVPTLPGLTINDERSFETEKQQLVALVHKFHQSGTDKVASFPHPFFGTLTKDQWGKGMYKHLDHHLQQFGV